MAHFAQIDENNIVIRVVASDDNDKTEEEAIEFLQSRLGGRWIQTSYNTYMNNHILGGEPLRKNYAGAGMIYDEELDAFVYPKLEEFPSFIFNEEYGKWEPPIPFPGKLPDDYPLTMSLEYFWDEENIRWIPNPDWVAPE